MTAFEKRKETFTSFIIATRSRITRAARRITIIMSNNYIVRILNFNFQPLLITACFFIPGKYNNTKLDLIFDFVTEIHNIQK